MRFAIQSEAFENGQAVPKKYTGDGEDVSPPLSWSAAPAGTKEFALICDDPDAPSPASWVHWIIYKLRADIASLPAALPPQATCHSPVAALQGLNSWSSGQPIGYRGPAPPKGHGVHHYHFRLYALDTELDLPPGIDKPALLDAMRQHIIAQCELIGTYSR